MDEDCNNYVKNVYHETNKDLSNIVEFYKSANKSLDSKLHSMKNSQKHKIDGLINVVEEVFTIYEYLDENRRQLSLPNRINSINQKLQDLDNMEIKLDELIKEADKMNTSLDNRDELIDILEEHVLIGNSTNYKLVSEIADIENEIYEQEKKLNEFDKISQYDPRISALEILDNHPQGISKVQMVKMMDISQYQAIKIIQEIIRLDLARMNNDIIYSTSTRIKLTP